MEDFSKYQTVYTGGKIHYNSVLEELVMTHGGQRAREEYKKLVQDKVRLVEAVKQLIFILDDIKEWEYADIEEAKQLLKEMEGGQDG